MGPKITNFRGYEICRYTHRPNAPMHGILTIRSLHRLAFLFHSSACCRICTHFSWSRASASRNFVVISYFLYRFNGLGTELAEMTETAPGDGHASSAGSRGTSEKESPIDKVKQQIEDEMVQEGRRKFGNHLEEHVLDYFHNNPTNIEACLTTCIKVQTCSQLALRGLCDSIECNRQWVVCEDLVAAWTGMILQHLSSF